MKVNLPYQKYLIQKKEETAPQTFLFRLKGEFNFEPGQFLQAYLPNVGEATFAPCSDPENKKFFEICVRESGNTTKEIAKLIPGDSLQLRGPLGKGWPTGKLIEQNIVIIAGGIGLIPLRTLLYQLDKYRKEFKNIYLLIGSKTPHHLIFKGDKWNFKYQKIITEQLDKSLETQKGLITELVEKVSLPKDSKVLVCGPEPMYKPVCEILGSKKISDKNIYISLERRMECGIGLCQHCNIGKYLVCKDGPVFRWDMINKELNK